MMRTLLLEETMRRTPAGVPAIVLVIVVIVIALWITGVI
jgi:hypothetical protein